jgi:hypothetical protein
MQGEDIPGNKMDSNNLATLFAPNILHSMKTTEGVTSPGMPKLSRSCKDVTSLSIFSRGCDVTQVCQAKQEM